MIGGQLRVFAGLPFGRVDVGAALDHCYPSHFAPEKRETALDKGAADLAGRRPRGSCPAEILSRQRVLSGLRQ